MDMSSRNQHQLQCPVCRLHLPDTVDQCPRCRADLTALALLARTARAWLERGREVIQDDSRSAATRQRLRTQLEFVGALGLQPREEAEELLTAIATEIEQEAETDGQHVIAAVPKDAASGEPALAPVSDRPRVSERPPVSDRQTDHHPEPISDRRHPRWTRLVAALVLGFIVGVASGRQFRSELPKTVDVAQAPTVERALPGTNEMAAPPQPAPAAEMEPEAIPPQPEPAPASPVVQEALSPEIAPVSPVAPEAMPPQPLPVSPVEPETTPTAPVAPPHPEVYVVVREGDSLWSLSRALSGRGALYPLLGEANNLTPSSLIHPGQLLRVPPEWVDRSMD